MTETQKVVMQALENGCGILRLNPAWVARDFLPAGKRLGLKEEEYCGRRAGLDQRALDRLDHEGGQPRRAARRGAEPPDHRGRRRHIP